MAVHVGRSQKVRKSSGNPEWKLMPCRTRGTACTTDTISRMNTRIREVPSVYWLREMHIATKSSDRGNAGHSDGSDVGG